MQKKLHWNAIGMESKTKLLLERIEDEKKQLPSEDTKRFRKIQGFVDELRNIVETIDRIKNELIPKLEEIFRLQFKTPELIYLALSRPSIRNIYENTEIYFQKNEKNTLNVEDYQNLAASEDAANVLALIGDSVLNLSVIQYFWDSSLSTVGKLTKKRSEIVKNENLAIVCDKWHLYEYRIKKLHEITKENLKNETVIHEKGTLIEALYGVVFLEFGFEESTRRLPLLQVI